MTKVRHSLAEKDNGKVDVAKLLQRRGLLLTHSLLKMGNARSNCMLFPVVLGNGIGIGSTRNDTTNINTGYKVKQKEQY